MKKFTEAFQIQENPQPVSDTLIDAYSSKVPQALIDLWKNNGLGKYNDGLIELIDPRDFEPTLWTWLGREVPHYVPFAISGFGELFYYRKLTETDEDVCMIDIQYRQIRTIVWSLSSFFENVLTDPEEREQWLRESLFNTAITAQGALSQNEIFTFVPVMAMGGGEELQYLQKGNAQVYQELVFQMTM